MHIPVFHIPYVILPSSLDTWADLALTLSAALLVFLISAKRLPKVINEAEPGAKGAKVSVIVALLEATIVPFLILFFGFYTTTIVLTLLLLVVVIVLTIVVGVMTIYEKSAKMVRRIRNESPRIVKRAREGVRGTQDTIQHAREVLTTKRV